MSTDADTPRATGDLRYWAFLSYSHRDAGIAVRLQQALETYRIPRSLMGHKTPVGEPAPAFLKPIFRDRDDLQASPDLKARVRAALAQSRYLIVICSPDAAHSDWVNDEIIEFKRLHGDQRVLALIVAGEPFASERKDHADEECFPEALRFDDVTPDTSLRRADESLPASATVRRRAAEPIAADLRPQGDGERLATLKLIAGMLGLGVDGLVRRDATRRNRRMAQVAFAALAGVIVMAGLTVMAVNARNEAQRQRAQAESLVEFMLTDLEKKLEPVGRLDILDSLGNKALAYYASQKPVTLDATSLSRRSQALRLIGDMREQSGHLDEALAAFQSAAETTKVLLERSPADGNRIFDHAQSVFYVGRVAYNRGYLAAAADAYQQYDDLANKLVRIDAGKQEWNMEPSWSAEAVGTVQLARGQFPEAQQSFRKALEITRRQAATDPGLARYEPGQMSWLADAQSAAGDYASALVTEHERLTYLTSDPAHDTDRQMQQEIAHANDVLATLELARNNPATAEPFAREATRLAWMLADLDAANVTWASDACFYELRLAEIEMEQGHLAAAHDDIRRVSAVAAKLAGNDAAGVNSRINLPGRTLALGARLAMREGKIQAIDELQRYLANVATMEHSGTELSRMQLAIVADAQLALGDLYAQRGDDDLARASWNGIVARLQPLGGTIDAPAIATLACAEAHLGQDDAANALFEAVAVPPHRRSTCSETYNPPERDAKNASYFNKGDRK
jgi:tetratricopeptide (TPR) repeat protein